jgi:hypothetical protein
VLTVLLVSGCTDERPDASDGARSSDEAASAAAPGATGRSSTSTSSTTTIDGLVDPGGLPPCDPQAGGYRTLPDWVVPGLPAELRPTSAMTHVRVEELDEPSPTQRTLVELGEDGTILSTIRLSSAEPGVRLPKGDDAPGHGVRDDLPMLDTVRGRPGEVAHWINRGDPIGHTGALWTEGGMRWAAESELGVEQLVGALEPLNLDGDEVTDPTGRYREMGAEPMWWSGQQRSTTVELDEVDARGDVVRAYTIQISPAVPGRHGLPVGAIVGSTLTEVAGRTTVLGASSASSLLSGGSVAVVTAAAADDAAQELDRGALERILTDLRPRTPEDDAHLSSFPLVPDSAGDPPPELCREP